MKEMNRPAVDGTLTMTICVILPLWRPHMLTESRLGVTGRPCSPFPFFSGFYVDANKTASRSHNAVKSKPSHCRLAWDLLLLFLDDDKPLLTIVKPIFASSKISGAQATQKNATTAKQSSARNTLHIHHLLPRVWPSSVFKPRIAALHDADGSPERNFSARERSIRTQDTAGMRFCHRLAGRRRRVPVPTPMSKPPSHMVPRSLPYRHAPFLTAMQVDAFRDWRVLVVQPWPLSSTGTVVTDRKVFFVIKNRSSEPGLPSMTAAEQPPSVHAAQLLQLPDEYEAQAAMIRHRLLFETDVRCPLKTLASCDIDCHARRASGTGTRPSTDANADATPWLFGPARPRLSSSLCPLYSLILLLRETMDRVHVITV
ncbi:hypothetical protein R3P38DRAFT_3561765 [Favolaschia claudopus]|uniref:Uncharacterized protein n=1 Tax=Favolaschia claudopus TaxID=2862362 RepID=A0AAW0AU31_9AGAR